MYLYAKDPYEAKYQPLINKQESTGLKNFNDSKALIEYSDDMDNIYKSIEEYNPNKKRKTSLLLDDMIVDTLSNKNLNPIVTEWFIRGKNLNISLIFITQSYFAIAKSVKLNSRHYFITVIPNKQELQQIAFNHSSDIDFKDYMNLFIKCTAKPYFCLVIDAALASDNPLRFRKNLLERI